MNVTIPCLLLLALAGGRAAAAEPARTGEAEVREVGGVTPCFTISQKEERRAGAPNFETIAVYDPSRQPKATMWAMSVPAGRSFSVPYSMCIPYGGRMSVLPQTPAAPLQPGKVYEVLIGARVADVADGTSSYAARFCLATQPNGSVIVHHIGVGAHEGRHLYGCVRAP